MFSWYYVAVQTTLGAQPVLGTQPHFEASGDLQVENVENAVIKKWGCPLKNGPKLVKGQPNRELKKYKRNNQKFNFCYAAMSMIMS